MALNLAKAVIGYLKERPEEKFTARQIAEWVFATYPDQCQAKKQSSQRLETDAELVQQIVREISSQRPVLQKRQPELKTTEGRPRKYYYSEKSDSAEVAAVESVAAVPSGDASQPKIDEHALYPRLSQYLWEEFGVYSKRIDEKRSSNKRGPNGNRWLYPDVVGMEDLGADWHQEVRDCVNQYSDKRTKLWSFEVKLLINRSNVRECFFQAVSNSSWANFGYLVAAEIGGTDTLKELRMRPARIVLRHAVETLEPLGQRGGRPWSPDENRNRLSSGAYVNPRLRPLKAQEGCRERRGPNARKRSGTDLRRGGVSRRRPPKTAPALGFQARKIPTNKGWDFGYWW